MKELIENIFSGYTDNDNKIRLFTRYIFDVQLATYLKGRDVQNEEVKTIRKYLLKDIGMLSTWQANMAEVVHYGQSLHELISLKKLDLNYQQARLVPLEQVIEAPNIVEGLTKEQIEIGYQAANELSYAFKNAIHPMRFFVGVVDIETGGLVTEINKENQRGSYFRPIFSVALQFADNDLNPITPVKEWIIHHDEETIASISDYVRNMHEQSGLLEKVRKSTLTIDKLESELLMYLHEHKIPKHNFKTNTFTIVAGNSVYTDWEFLSTRAPRFTRHFNYQLLDFSALQMCNKMTGLPIKTTVKQYKHTAVEDLAESLLEGREFLAVFKALKTLGIGQDMVQVLRIPGE